MHGWTTLTLTTGHFLPFVLVKLCTNQNVLFGNHTAFCWLSTFPFSETFGILAVRWLTHGPLSSRLACWLGSWWLLPDVNQEGSTNLRRCSTLTAEGKGPGVCVLLQSLVSQASVLLPSSWTPSCTLAASRSRGLAIATKGGTPLFG